MVVINEEKVIRRCLESIHPIVDEIILLHDGECKDSTLEIAQQFNAKIFVLPYYGDAEKRRALGFSKATGDWILHIDADEYLSPEAQNAIPHLIENTTIDAYALKWPIWDGKSAYVPGPLSNETKPILFRKSKLYFLGITHETPRTYGVLKERKDLLLEHKPAYNNNTMEKMIHKWFRWR